MLFDSDVVLIGTGVAPLVAAHQLELQGKSVLILNPEFDFFGENSEFSFDPLWPWKKKLREPKRLGFSQAEAVLADLRPEFPGSLESWPTPTPGVRASGTKATLFSDPVAPYVRSRSRLFLRSRDEEAWEAVEEMFLRASDAGIKPQIQEGLLAVRGFPGVALHRFKDSERWKGVVVPKLADVDVSRFQNGVREFIRERMGPGRMVTSASPIELTEDGVRYRDGGAPRTVRVRDGVLVFWTPRLTNWILQQADRAKVRPVVPKGVRVWEEWSLISKDPIDPSMVGCMDDLLVWGEVEGSPGDQPLHRLNVLRAGELSPMDAKVGVGVAPEGNWASAESFRRISILCHEFLRWDKFTVRSMKSRAVLEWENEPQSFPLFRRAYEARVFARADGPLANVVREARLASEHFQPERGVP